MNIFRVFRVVAGILPWNFPFFLIVRKLAPIYGSLLRPVLLRARGAAPAAQPILQAIGTLKAMNADNLRKVPADSPTDFVRKRWKALDYSFPVEDFHLCSLPISRRTSVRFATDSAMTPYCSRNRKNREKRKYYCARRCFRLDRVYPNGKKEG
jgi:hypothetical protein